MYIISKNRKQSGTLLSSQSIVAVAKAATQVNYGMFQDRRVHSAMQRHAATDSTNTIEKAIVLGIISACTCDHTKSCMQLSAISRVSFSRSPNYITISAFEQTLMIVGRLPISKLHILQLSTSYFR